MNEYVIEPAGSAVPLCGDPSEGLWTKATTLRIGEHPWVGSDREVSVKSGIPIEATARLLYDEQALYLQYRVVDGHQQATTTELNGQVWTDSCVELFASPVPEDRQRYFNFEANCVGQFRLGFGSDRKSRRTISPELAEAIRIETSVDGSRKEPDPENDEQWWLAAALPFEVLREFTGVDLDHSTGTAWRGNLQCCREDSMPSYAVWSPIDAPAPDFHRPDQFGRLVFG